MKNKIFITAKPGSGKTTAIKEIVSQIGIEKCKGFYTEEIRKNQKRAGFKIKTLDGREGILASTDSKSGLRHGKYGLDIETFEELCLSSIESGIDDDKVIVIDEVGPMEMHSEKFKTLLKIIIKRPSIVIGSICYRNFPWIDEFKRSKEIEVIELNLENRNDIPSIVLTKLGIK
ncbi:nucleoside-triphosphatase [Peptoclostridium litorale DSM 5388]|uniref:Nucleoside-triphosphatase n=1 Tax=Peptoclostridium litorale DSM 5388 TaxID=1121324 RepID=A0A069RQF8_PEPLI|nr:nucleoside-triphosphatase [Peptoclostridium litorale]KDR96407.1 nucleoside-triphosphatase [Peptoclostridium litorale DSM 5388]SIN70950.1 nucleoside-triphosphatase [Peptoclostridium litorale DSM 5388]